MNKHMKQVGAGAAALALVFALAGPAFAADATVDGHAASTPQNNNPDFWGDDCTKLDAGEGDLGDDQATYVLGASYALVIVKAGAGASAGDNALTIFEDVAAGETVFADSNGNNVSDPGGQDGDKNISHIIFCDETETTSTTSFESSEESTTDSVSSTTSFSDSVSDTTSQPPTDTIGATGTGQQSGGLWMLLAVLGVLAGSVIVLAPSKAKSND
jgi:hypothetical protein